MPGGLSAAEEAALDAMLEGRDSDDEEDDIMALLGEDEQGTDDDEGDDDDDADDDDDDDGDGDADGDAGDDDDGNGAGAVAAPAAPAASASALAADAGESDDGSSSKEDDDSSSASLDALGVVDGVAAKGSAPEKVEPAANAKGEGVALSTPAKAEEPEVGAVHEETSTADKGADPAPDVRQEAAVAEDAAAATGALEAADKGAAVAEDAAAATGALEGAAVAEDAVVATSALDAADAATADDADASKNDVEDAAGDEGDDAAGDVTEPAAKKRREKEDSSDDGGDMEADEGGDTASGCPQRPPSAFRLFSQALRLELAGTGLTVPEMAKKINERWAELDPAKQAEYHASSQQARDEYVVALAKYHRSSEYHKYVDKQAALEKKQASRRLKAEFAGKLPKRPQRARDLFRAEKKITGKFEDLAKAWDALPEGEQSRYKAEAAKLKADYDRAVAAYRDTEGRRIQKEERAAIRRADIKAARLKFLVDAPKRPPAAKALFAVERRKSDPSKGDALAPAVAQKMSAEKLSAEWEALPADEQTKFEEQAARLRTEYDKEWEEFKKTDDYKALRKVEEGASASERKSKGTDKSKGKGKGKGRGKNEATVAPESMPTMPPSAYDTWAKDRKARGAKSSRKDWGALPADEKAALEKKREEDVAAYKQALAAWEKSKEGKRYLRKKDAATAKATTKRKLETAFNEFFNGNPPKRPPAPMMLFAASSERAPGKVAEAWSNLSSDAKQKWEAKRTELVKAYEQRIEDFKKSTSYKKATKAGPAKEAKSSKKDAAAAPTKAKLETKSETAVKDFFKGDLPKKPPSGMMLFAASGEKKPGTMVAAAWAALSSDEKAKWEAKRIELLKEYQEKMDKCKSSAAYKKAAKADEQAKTKQSRKDKDKKAREKFLQGSNAPVAPKQPASAFRLFLDAERPNLPAGLSGPEQASKLGEKWKAMDTAARAQFCEKAEQLKAAYEQEMQTYKSHPAYKKYEQAVRKLKGVAGKDAKGNKEKEERDEAYQLIYGGPKRVSAGGSSTAGTGSRGGRGRGGGSRGRGRGKPGAVDAKLGSSDSDDSGSSSSSSSESLNI